MDNKAIKYGILVNSCSDSKNHRTYELGISDDRIKNSHHLSCYDWEMTNEAIKSLESLISSKKGEYDWGTEQIMITSEPEISTLEDYMYEESLPNVKTSLLLNLMKEWRLFQLKYNDKETLQQIVKKAYNLVILNPKKYVQRNSKTDYDICIDRELISLQLIKKQGDFKLNPDEYASQIKRIVW